VFAGTVDLGRLDFIDSTGLVVFVGGLKGLREHGVDLALRSPSASARKVFEITGLTELFANQLMTTESPQEEASPTAGITGFDRSEWSINQPAKAE